MIKKLLLPIFSSVLLTSSASLVATSNVNTSLKITEQKETIQNFNNTKQEINNLNNLDEKQMEEIRIASQKWNDEEIDQIISRALEYHDNQVTINQEKLDANKLPPELLNHLDLALSYLNNAINSGYIKAYAVNSNIIQLNYQTENTTSVFNSDNNEIIYFENKNEKSNTDVFEVGSLETFWFSSYGPSAWWKFWEWGGYIHINEEGMRNAKFIQILAKITSFALFLKNFTDIQEIFSDLLFYKSINDAVKADESLNKLSGLLRDANLGLLGTIEEIIGILTGIIAVGIALLTLGSWVEPLIGLIADLISRVIDEMLRVDRGWGIKWDFRCYIWPNGFSPE